MICRIIFLSKYRNRFNGFTLDICYRRSMPNHFITYQNKIQKYCQSKCRRCSIAVPGSYTHRSLYHLPPPLFPVKWSSIWQPGGWGEVWDELPLISLGDTFPPTQDESIFKMFPANIDHNDIQKFDIVSKNLKNQIKQRKMYSIYLWPLIPTLNELPYH